MEKQFGKTVVPDKNIENKQNIERVSHDNCCGCGVCFNVCPHNAITMKKDQDGFLYPQVDSANCINCGSCCLTCPSLDPVSSNSPIPQCYAVWASHDVRKKSSSGGAFTLLAEYVLERNGLVCGAAFDENWQVQHIIIDKKKDLELLRGSKYVQSDTSDIYKRIKKNLQTGTLVLFSGCPCQVTGLQKYLQDKFSRNLITVDIFCHSIASPGIWQKYLSERFSLQAIDQINFRDKDSTGWSCRKCTVSVKGEKQSSEEFVQGFHRGLYARTSCENCTFSLLPRPGDFTIGDWWGINAFNSDFNDDKGTSLLLVNNERRQEMINEIKKKARLFSEVPLKYIGKNGHIYGSLQLPAKRPIFLDMLRRGVTFTKAITAFCDEQYDFGVIGFWYGMNYGSMLTSFALYKSILNLGHTAILINKPYDLWEPRYSNNESMPNRFFRSNCLVSDRDNNFYKLNDHCKAFIVGSDTVWDPFLVGKRLPFFFLDFVSAEKNKVSFASSFGRKRYKIDDPLLRQYARYACRRLTHISVREDIGLDILKDEFEKNATRVLDPVFLLKPEEYRLLAEAGPDMKHNENFIFSYILGIEEPKIKAYQNIVDCLKLPTVNFPNPNMLPEARKAHPLEIITDDSLESWLYGIDNAHLVVADSFHAVCFSIILRSNFIIILRKNDPLNCRFESLLNLLQIRDRIVYVNEDINLDEIIANPIDFDNAHQTLRAEKNKSLNWLKIAITTPPDRSNTEDNVENISFENSMTFLRRELEETKQHLQEARQQGEPLIDLAKVDKNTSFSAKTHLTESFIIRSAFRFEYWRYRLLSAIIPTKRRQQYYERLRAVKLAISLLFNHKSKN